MKVYNDPVERRRALARRKMADKPDRQLCLLVMISHSYPFPGETGELIPVHHRRETKIDPIEDQYLCYSHYDITHLPGNEANIATVEGPYLGRMQAAVLEHYRRQMLAVQEFQRGESLLKPRNVIFA